MAGAATRAGGRAVGAAAVAWAACASPAAASEPASGTFVATRACDAFQSMRKQTNPGQVRLVPGTAYAVREANGPDRAWWRVEVPGAASPLRWVPADCGSVSGSGSTEGAAPSAGGHGAGRTAGGPAGRGGRPSGAGAACSVAGQADSHVLAVSWQPGFCEHVKYNGRKPECDRMADGRLVVKHLTLHGLWPNRQACGTRYGDCGGPPLDLRPDTLAHVRPWMPNFQFEQAFGRHEWDKHGTCAGMDDDTYFRRAVDAVKVLDASDAGRYIAANAGRSISRKVFDAKVRSETGRGDAVHAITLLCTNQQLYEIRVRLPVDFKGTGSLNDLLGPTLPSAPSKDAKACRGDEIRVEASGR